MTSNSVTSKLQQNLTVLTSLGSFSSQLFLSLSLSLSLIIKSFYLVYIFLFHAHFATLKRAKPITYNHLYLLVHLFHAIEFSFHFLLLLIFFSLYMYKFECCLIKNKHIHTNAIYGYKDPICTHPSNKAIFFSLFFTCIKKRLDVA